MGNKLIKAEQLELIISVIGTEWITYRQIKKRIDDKISIGGISKVIWDNIDKIKDKIEWKDGVFGNNDWQIRTYFKIK